MISIDRSDFVKAGQLAVHCDLPKLAIAIEEAIEFDLTPVLCNLQGQVREGWTTTEGVVFDVVAPKKFNNCKGFETSHLGLRRVLVYYAYARYLIINAFNDTPNGNVDKQSPYSIPKPLKETQSLSDKYKSMALESYRKVEEFMLKNKTNYPGLDCSKLQHCGCNGSCGTNLKTKGFGMRSRNVSRA